MNENDELTPQEAETLQRLRSGPAAPEALEDQTIERLNERGLIVPLRPVRGRWLLAAAGLALFAAGLFVGERRGTGSSGTLALPRYALFLYDSKNEAALTSAQLEARVEEYRNWVRSVRRGGGEIYGEKLEAEGRLLGDADRRFAGEALGGYFVVSAADLESAVAVARTCPHLKHGGSIEVRPIAPT
jgi:hypothetical protein